MLSNLPALWWLAPIGAAVALISAFLFYRSVMSNDEGTDQMKEIAQAVREGAMAYLASQYRIVAMVFVGLFVVFLVLALTGLQSMYVPFVFLVGGVFSTLTGYIGMKTATNASARTAAAARTSLNDGLQVAFRAGAVMGLSVVGFALINVSVIFLILFLVDQSLSLTNIMAILLGGAFGASTQALFARVGGGIFTKAADVGADLVGKVEAGIPEDDPRNPATIADNVGDNVGDVAGMGADLYESYMGSILATASLGVAAIATTAPDIAASVPAQMQYLSLPMAIAGAGAIISVLGTFLVQTKEDATAHELMGALDRGINASAAGVAVVSFFIIRAFNLIEGPTALWISVVTGILVGITIGKATERYTSAEYAPTRSITAQGESGAATVIIQGLAVGMRSTWIPVVTVVIGIAVSFYISGGSANTLFGLYGVGLAAVAMLSTLGITLATDAYGPIADNAGGNAEMAGLPPEVRERTDQLDSVGNTTAATGKGFAIGSAALTALALIAAYIEQIRDSLGGDALVNGVSAATATIEDFMSHYNVTLMNPSTLIGLFLGAMAVFFFSAMTMEAVGRAAGAMVQEVRRQFREYPGIMDGSQKPDYKRCVEISTLAAQKEMTAPAVLAIVIPIAVGIIFGVAGVIGLLAGGLSTGFVMAVMMSNAGGAWDNAKKYVEAGAHGGKGSETHKATVVGDTVGDPFKDTSGPSLNILIKLMSMVSVVFAGVVAATSGGFGLISMFF